MRLTGTAFIALTAALGHPMAAAADCPTRNDPIATDRPTFANSSAVVPAQSLQLENGVGATGAAGGTIWDLPETRTRFGIGSCTEVLVDLPDYSTGSLYGWSSAAPALKHQFTELPEGVTLSGAVGLALGTGARRIAGRGPAPYVQFPAGWDLGAGWSVNGMYGLTFHPEASAGDRDSQATVFLDRMVSDAADVFVEYANDLDHRAPTLNRLSAGGSWRYASTSQIDAKIGVGLNRASPDWYVTIGYSLRFDEIF